MHKSITAKRIMDAIRRRNSALLDNPGFCKACGEEAIGCEPDARNYKCIFCGENAVDGAEEFLFSI